MKFLFSTTIIILAAGMVLPAQANSNALAERVSNGSPSLDPVSVDARDLTTETTPRGSSAESPNSSDHLSEQAQQINRRLSTQQESPFELRDFLDLPDGVIIRGGSRGGVGLGREF